MVARWAHNPKVDGSSPSCAIFIFWTQYGQPMVAYAGVLCAPLAVDAQIEIKEELHIGGMADIRMRILGQILLGPMLTFGSADSLDKKQGAEEPAMVVEVGWTCVVPDGGGWEMAMDNKNEDNKDEDNKSRGMALKASRQEGFKHMVEIGKIIEQNERRAGREEQSGEQDNQEIIKLLEKFALQMAEDKKSVCMANDLKSRIQRGMQSSDIKRKIGEIESHLNNEEERQRIIT